MLCFDVHNNVAFTNARGPTDIGESTSVFQIRTINWSKSINDKSPLIGLFRI